MQELQLLNSKLETLLKRYSSLQAENLRLKKTISKHNRTLETMNKKVADCEEQILVLQARNALTSTEDKATARKQIDNLINDIDKILASLND